MGAHLNTKKFTETGAAHQGALHQRSRIGVVLKSRICSMSVICVKNEHTCSKLKSRQNQVQMKFFCLTFPPFSFSQMKHINTVRWLDTCRSLRHTLRGQCIWTVFSVFKRMIVGYSCEDVPTHRHMRNAHTCSHSTTICICLVFM